MQVLWSRAAQTRSSCRCSSCLQTAATIARRTTTAASKRQLKVGDLFTACYSTILGTAAFVDAKAKEERRKEWDRVIAEAKSGIPMNESERVERALPNRDHVPSSNSVTKSAFEDSERASRVPAPIPVTWNDSSWATNLSTKDTSLEGQLRTLDSHLKQSLISVAKERSRSQSDSRGEWWDEEEPNPVFAARDPKTRIHLDKMEEMISKLVSRLLLGGKYLSLLRGSSKVGDDLSVRLKEMAKRIASLQRGDTRLPAYTWIDSQSAESERFGLNKALEVLFEKTASDYSNIDLMLAKICYNLLVSTAPPNVQTYNLLICYFTRLKLHEHAQIIVDSFLYDSRFKPNSAIVCLILDHYSAKGDASGFRAVVNRMRGADGDMGIKRRSIDNLCRRFEREWASANKVIYKKGWLSQKVPRNVDIFNSLIQGSLRFGHVQTAVVYIRAALREGQQLSSATLCDVIAACMKAFNYTAAKSLLETLLSEWEGESTPTVVYDAGIRWAVYRLLGLCGIESSMILKQNLSQSPSRTALQNMLSHMNLQSVDEAIGRSESLIISLESILGLKRPRPAVVKSEDFPFEREDRSMNSKPVDKPCVLQSTTRKGINKALYILQKASAVERLRSGRRDANAERTRFLDCRVAKSKEDKFHKTLSTECKSKFDDLITSRPPTPSHERLELPSNLSKSSLAESSQSNLIVLYSKLPMGWRIKYDELIERNPSMNNSQRLQLLSELSTSLELETANSQLRTLYNDLSKYWRRKYDEKVRRDISMPTSRKLIILSDYATRMKTLRVERPRQGRRDANRGPNRGTQEETSPRINSSTELVDTLSSKSRPKSQGPSYSRQLQKDSFPERRRPPQPSQIPMPLLPVVSSAQQYNRLEASAG